MTELPSGWRTASLKELATSVRKSVDLNSSGMYELWSVPSFADGQPEIVAGADVKSGKLAVHEDDVLICKINPRINRVWLVGERRDWPQVASPEWIVARVSDSQQVSARYLRAYCQSPEFRAAITADVSGVTGSHTRAKPAVVMSLQVPVPSLGEQAEIVRILDMQLARLDTVLEAVQAVRDRADQLRRSLLHAAFTGQLTQPDPSRDASDLPDGWKAASLKELVTSVRKSVDLESSGMYELWSVPSFADGQPEIVAGVDVKSGKLAVQKDDVLICKINPRINRVWLVGERRDWPQVASPEWIVARVSDLERVSARYLRAYCGSPEFRSAITAEVSGVTGSHTRAKPALVMSLQVPVPSLGEQAEIVQVIEHQFGRLDEALAVADRVELECGRLRRSLLQAAFTGELTKTWRGANG